MTWSASAAPTTPTGYYVTRINGTNSPSPACNTSATATIAGRSCTDAPVSIGTYTYTVTAVYHSWTAASTASAGVTVSQGTQAISFTSTAPAGAAVGGNTYSVIATGGASGNAVTFTIDASATSNCSIAGSTVSFTAVGTCTINANQAGNANYVAAPQKQQSFAIGKGAQTITFTSNNPNSATVGGSTYTATAAASSGLPVALSLDGTSTGCALSGSTSGSTVSFSSVGTCKVNATQAGNGTYLAAGQVQQSFAVAKGAQTIAFISTTPSNATVSGSTYAVTASGGASGNPVTFTVDATSTLVCSIAGSTVSFTAVGTCTIDAHQAASTDYTAASQVQQSFAVGKGAQAITFTSTVPSSASVGGSPYTVTASASSGLPVLLTLDASSTGCTLSGSSSGSTVSFASAGTCVINANQGGNANYFAAGQLQQSFVVAKANQTITFTSNPVSPSFGGTYPVSATGGGSGNPVIFSSSTTSVCTVSTSTVTFVSAGSCTINANQTGNGNYNAAPQVQQTFAVAAANQTITFTSNAPSSAFVGGSTYTVAATGGGSGNPVIFSSATTSVCTVSTSTVTFVSAGSCTINANQAGNGNYNAAPQVQQAFTISTPGTTLSISSFTQQSGQRVLASGTAAYGTSGDAQTITVVFCAVNTFPCTGSNVKDTRFNVSVNQATGAWSISSANLGNGISIYGRATQTRTAGNLTSSIVGPVTS